MRLNRFMIRPLVEAGLREELNAGDTTGGFLIWDDDPVQTAQIYAKGHGVACGLLFADETIMLIDPQAQIEHCVEEGAPIAPVETTTTKGVSRRGHNGPSKRGIHHESAFRRPPTPHGPPLRRHERRGEARVHRQGARVHILRGVYLSHLVGGLNVGADPKPNPGREQRCVCCWSKMIR